MAATRLIPLHINKGKTLAQCLADRTDYAQNPEKTEKGELVTGYGCDPMTCDEEFLLSKRQYQQSTGRRQKGDIIAYQIRQSFKPGEVTPEEANQIGQELAMRFTKGKHAFLVATHTDRAHIHNHIVFNSTSLDCKRKFRNFYLSSFAIQRISDLICLEHGLSVIDPKPYRERAKRKDYPRQATFRDEICAAIDAAMQKKPKDFQQLIALLAEAGYEYKDGKQPALRGNGQQRFIRFRSLGEGYTVEDLQAALDENSKRKSRQTHQRAFDLPIDIQEKLRAGKGAGYARWAKVHNLKQAAKVVMFLQDNHVHSLEELREIASQKAARYEALSAAVKSSEKRLNEIAVLRTHIINYSKTRDVYVAYRKAGYSKKFFEAHREELTLHKAAKEAFDQLGISKIPRVKELSAEYARVLDEKKKAYAEYRKVREEMREYQIALKTAEAILEETQEKDVHSEQQQGR